MTKTITVLLLACAGLFAQAPNCSQKGTLTTAVAGTSIDNRLVAAPACILWRVEYYSTGFSAVSFQLEGAPDNGSGAAGTFAAVASTFIQTGSNPSTNIDSALIVANNYYAWFRVKLVSKTGTGSLRYDVKGFNASTARLGTGGIIDPGTAFQVAQYLGGSHVGGATVPNCADTGGNHLNFDSGTGAFSCGTSGGGGSGTVGSGTQYQAAQYTGPGTTTAVAGVSIPTCADTGGQHLNFDASTGVYTCGTSGGSAGAGVLLSGTSDPGVPVESVVQSSSGLVSSIAYSASVTAGNLLVVCIAVDGSSSNAVVSDTLLNTWVQQGSVSAATKRAQIWATVSASSGANTVAATVAGGSFQVMGITEVSGNVTSTLDAQSTGAGAPAAITTVTPYDLVFTCGAHNGGFAFTGSQILTTTNNGGGSLALGLQVVPTASTVTSNINSGASIYATRAIQPASVASPGSNGDWYLQLTSGLLWGPKTSGTWGHSGWKFTAE